MTYPSDRTYSANSVGELINIVASIVGHSNSKYWYRGQVDSNWNLLPSVFRTEAPDEQLKSIERDQMHNFRSRAGVRYSQKPAFENISGWLSLAQHYGLPTRLLDWSRSPLVAAYFSIERYLYELNVQPIDACIWCLQPHSMNLEQELGDYTVTIDSGECRNELNPAFYHESEETGKVRGVMSSETDLRMFVQQGAFTIHSTTKPLEEMSFSKGVLYKICFPSAAVVRIAQELAVSGFRKGDIYPDLQNLATDLSKTHINLDSLKNDV